MDLTCYRGEQKTIQFTLSPTTNITGWTIVATCRSVVAGAVAFTESGVITDAAGGVFTITLTASDTDRALGEYRWDVWRTDASNPGPLEKPGTLTILPSVYKP